MPDRAFSCRQGERIAEVFRRHAVEYLFIGKSGAIFYGFPDTTQDAALFPEKNPENGRRIAAALRDLGFPVDGWLESNLIRGKDFAQIRSGPFDVDLVFAPDGIESFQAAKAHSSLVAGIFPVASLRDIIRSKRAANRRRTWSLFPVSKRSPTISSGVLRRRSGARTFLKVAGGSDKSPTLGVGS